MNLEFNAESIKEHLKTDAELIVYDSIASSNDVAKDLAKTGTKEGTVVIAKRQTKGKGRLGRSFISNEENGLYMSIILRPQKPIESYIDITALTAVATLLAIEASSGAEAKIKWVNDIYINDKKVCGILTEAAYSVAKQDSYFIVCGIGINIEPPKNGFDEEIKSIAGAIYEKNAPDGYKSLLCAKIIDNFFEIYNSTDTKDYMSIYRTKSNIIGKMVDVYKGNDVISGVAIDINDRAELVIRGQNGEIHTFNSGEARVRKTGTPL